MLREQNKMCECKITHLIMPQCWSLKTHFDPLPCWQLAEAHMPWTKLVMISIRKGPWERRCDMKGQDEEKSAAQEENCNITPVVQLRPRLNIHRSLLA